MAVTIVPISGGSFPRKTPATFVLLYSLHWNAYVQYKGTPLYLQADIQLRTMVRRIKSTLRALISSDIEIKKILEDVSNASFVKNYNTFGFSVSCAAMLGMQLFEICVYDTDEWWYPVPKPLLKGHVLQHSHYQLKH
jgi:hypothetical protein